MQKGEKNYVGSIAMGGNKELFIYPFLSLPNILDSVYNIYAIYNSNIVTYKSKEAGELIP